MHAVKALSKDGAATRERHLGYIATWNIDFWGDRNQKQEIISSVMTITNI